MRTHDNDTVLVYRQAISDSRHQSRLESRMRLREWVLGCVISAAFAAALAWCFARALR